MTYRLSDPAFLADPAPALARMRTEGSLVRVRLPLIGSIWLTTTDAAARRVLKSPDQFARDPRQATGKSLVERYWWLPRFMHPLFQSMLGFDGPDHARLRRLVDSAFARTRIDDLTPQMIALSDDLLATMDPADPVELIGSYARPLPLMTICAMMGIPDADRARVAHWISPISGPTTAWSMGRALPGLWRVMRHFRHDFETVRRAPRPGLIRDLVEAEADGDRLSDDELLAMVVTLFIAGHETTVHLIGMGILRVLTDPAARAALAGPTEKVPMMVEEVMRHASPVMMSKPHFVMGDMDFDGIRLRQGDQVAALLIGANYDPARFDAPVEFVPDRRPCPHLGFGHGPHVCLGMQLARTEARVGLTRLFARYPGIRLLDPAKPPDYTRRIGIHGLRRLDVVLGPRAF